MRKSILDKFISVRGIGNKDNLEDLKCIWSRKPKDQGKRFKKSKKINRDLVKYYLLTSLFNEECPFSIPYEINPPTPESELNQKKLAHDNPPDSYLPSKFLNSPLEELLK